MGRRVSREESSSPTELRSSKLLSKQGMAEGSAGMGGRLKGLLAGGLHEAKLLSLFCMGVKIHTYVHAYMSLS